MKPKPSPKAQPVIWLRGLVCLAGLVWLVGLPLARQGFLVDSVYLHRWVMFTGFGLDICEVRYSTRDADGKKERIDRIALLANSGQSPKRVQFVRSGAEARRLGQSLCAKLGRGTDLRLFARCATREGWRVTSKPNSNLCSPGNGLP